MQITETTMMLGSSFAVLPLAVCVYWFVRFALEHRRADAADQYRALPGVERPEHGRGFTCPESFRRHR